METGVTNNHFKLVIKEVQGYLDRNEDVPRELFIDFIGELKYSNLLLPGYIDGDDLIFENLTSEDSTVLPLYTDDDVFANNYSEGSEYEALPNEIDYYVELINDHELDGVLINQNSLDFFIAKDLLGNVTVFPDISIKDDFEGYGPDKLLKIAQNASNDSLLEFIKSGNDQFEALMLELSKATLLNVVASDESLDKFAKDGIISIDDISDYELCTTNDGENDYAILFTDVDAINKTKPKGNFYCQIALIDDIIDFALRSDMAGIIINPGLDDYLISRDYLIESFGGLAFNNPSFKNAPDYLFII